MPTEAQILAIDRVPDKKPEKRCTNCGYPKPIGEFARNRTRRDGHSDQCRQCLRIGAYERYHEGGGKEATATYNARPEVKARRRDYDRGRQERRDASRAAQRKTPRGKVLECRYSARSKFRRAVTDERLAALEALIAAYDRELARLDATKGLPAEPDAGPGRKYGKSPARGVYLTPAGTYEVKVSVGKAKSVRGGTFATLDEARDAADALAFRLLGVRGYATPREERRRA